MDIYVFKSIKNEESLKSNDLSFHLKILEQNEQIKSKLNGRKERNTKNGNQGKKIFKEKILKVGF